MRVLEFLRFFSDYGSVAESGSLSLIGGLVTWLFMGLGGMLAAIVEEVALGSWLSELACILSPVAALFLKLVGLGIGSY